MVMKHFEIPINYTVSRINHGNWIGNVLMSSKSEYLAFFDSDCVPINPISLENEINKTFELESFVGIAQASNHKQDFKHHIFAAPGFLIIKRSIYDEFNRPNLTENYRSDIAQELSHIADERDIPYGLIYPTFYEKGPAEMKGGPWNLGNYGYYGIGTTYGDICYHLYQGRFNDNIELFEKRCTEIINGEFSTSNMIKSKK
jgi:hypothetical protein